ncbi:MAG: cob(I)yrinic acid a,c-diamide adenosyltransferase [Chloroflexi bacterium RBG_16_48_7]|nr:MAG: cob(I)yrinic acid a,c-diamide adenosyltransferase [Chloroflexi bacterium RBG_16_48_7]
MTKGLVQVYTGDGKGKTTAALGLALRACGHGMSVIFIQFVKGIPTGEHAFVSRYHPFEIAQIGKGDCFTKDTNILESEARETIQFAREQIVSNKYDLVILDEILIALHIKLLSMNDVMDLIDQKPESVELVMTGRNAPQEIIDRADLVTEMRMIKHPFSTGVAGRRGIEF